jgi:hypothetical protein
VAPKPIFAQTAAEQSNRAHTCGTAMERNKNTVDDYSKIILEDTSTKFTDHNFPYNDALFWKDAGEAGRDMS